MTEPATQPTGSSIVASGGWVTVRQQRRPKTMALGVLSLAWVPLDACVWTLCELAGDGPLFHLRLSQWAVPEWACVILVGLHPVWIGLFVYFLICEPTQTMTREVRNPGYDLRRLY